MKVWIAIFFPMLILAQGCQTQPRRAREFRYFYHLAESGMTTLEALDAGDIDKAQVIAMMNLSDGLARLRPLGSDASPTDWESSDIERRNKLARWILKYAVAHKESMASVYGSLTMARQLEKLLVDESDLRQARELREYLAEEGVENHSP